MFSSAAGSDIAPPGLLNGITAIPSAGKAGAEGAADDLALLAGAIGASGINADDMIVITAPPAGHQVAPARLAQVRQVDGEL